MVEQKDSSTEQKENRTGQSKGQNEHKLSSFLTRLISGLVLLLLLFVILPLGGLPVLIFCLFLSLFASYELLHCFSLEKKGISFLSYFFVILYYSALFLQIPISFFLLLSYLFLLGFYYVLSYPKADIREIALLFLVFPYAGILLSYIYLCRSLPHGKVLVWLVFLSSWGADTCAYCTGLLFGRHKMTPVLSPKKTWEGAVGGILGSGILSFIFAIIFKGHGLPLHLSPYLLALAVSLAALFSIGGDLMASGMKRDFQIKDYSHLIPGHGGILDRFDSVLFTAPIIYYGITVLDYFKKI